MWKGLCIFIKLCYHCNHGTTHYFLFFALNSWRHQNWSSNLYLTATYKYEKLLKVLYGVVNSLHKSYKRVLQGDSISNGVDCQWLILPWFWAGLVYMSIYSLKLYNSGCLWVVGNRQLIPLCLYVCDSNHFSCVNTVNPCIKMWHSDKISRPSGFNTSEPEIE